MQAEDILHIHFIPSQPRDLPPTSHLSPAEAAMHHPKKSRPHTCDTTTAEEPAAKKVAKVALELSRTKVTGSKEGENGI